MAEPLKIAFLHYRDARDVRNWSGTLYFSKEAFRRNVGEVVDLSPAPVRLLPFRVVKKLVHLATGKMYSYDHDPLLARLYGRHFGARLAEVGADLVFSPAGSSCLAHLETDVPIVYYSDATWRVVQDYYPNYSNVVARTERAGDDLERRTLERADVCLFSSQWAADSAVRDYGADPAKVHNVYIGANLPAPPGRAEVLPRRLGEQVRLLFVGVLWEVKGGEIAHGALLRLLELGFDARLTVVGCTPPEGFDHPRMEVIPFLNKQVPAERERFERLWRDADLFVLPSRCEAAGVVFCEAAAHALPVFATATGGVPSIVAEGRNGFTVPLEATGAEWGDRIAALARDPERYARLCETSRDEFEQRLNWDAWGARVADIIAERFPALRDRIHARRSSPVSAH